MIEKHPAKDQDPLSMHPYNTRTDDVRVKDEKVTSLEGSESGNIIPEDQLSVRLEKQYKRETTRAALVEATQALVMERGKEKFTIQDITHRANVCSGTFYNYFESKHKIFEAIAESMRAEFTKELDKLRAPLKDPAMIVAVTLNHCFERAQNHETWNSFVSATCLSDEYFLHQDADQCYQDIERGVTAGRFKVGNIPFTQRLILAMVQHISSEIRLGNLENNAIEDATQAILKMLGISDVIAKALTQPIRPPIARPKRNHISMSLESQPHVGENAEPMLQPISNKARVIS